MKVRILFVDDEPLILQGLRRMLRNMHEVWEPLFAASGPEALALIDQQPVDVVVSDMRMPGMDGAALLNEVLLRHPQTLRFILSGHSDRDAILRCVGSTHQYLSKPCEVGELRATIERASGLRSSIQADAVLRLVTRIGKLPSLPQLYVDVLQKLREPEVSLDQIGDIVSRDPGMTALLLKLVNSAFFGLGRNIANPAEAVSYLGVETLKSLILGIHAFTQFDDSGLSAPQIAALWNHSLQTALGAQAIAQLEAVADRLAEEAFTGGLLHDVGRLVLAANFPGEYTEVIQRVEAGSTSLVEAETRILGTTHADVGGYLLGLWGLPTGVVEAIALHHTPHRAVGRGFGPLTAVCVANEWCARPLNNQQPPTLSDTCRSYLTRIHCAERLPAWHAALRTCCPATES